MQSTSKYRVLSLEKLRTLKTTGLKEKYKKISNRNSRQKKLVFQVKLFKTCEMEFVRILFPHQILKSSIQGSAICMLRLETERDASTLPFVEFLKTTHFINQPMTVQNTAIVINAAR